MCLGGLRTAGGEAKPPRPVVEAAGTTVGDFRFASGGLLPLLKAVDMDTPVARLATPAAIDAWIFPAQDGDGEVDTALERGITGRSAATGG